MKTYAHENPRTPEHLTLTPHSPRVKRHTEKLWAARAFCSGVQSISITYSLLWRSTGATYGEEARASVATVEALFWRTDAGGEPARDFIKSMSRDDRHTIGGDLATLQVGWPIGMPLCRPMGQGLHELRSDLPSGVTARLLFCHYDGQLVILHGFVKKTAKTPKVDLELARKRKATLERIPPD